MVSPRDHVIPKFCTMAYSPTVRLTSPTTKHNVITKVYKAFLANVLYAIARPFVRLSVYLSVCRLSHCL